ncbi:uncharacterized protein LOC126263107 [Schistocerca nitens]|uniref:uncharacterized protein LOC126263107 n=1 Tax=Schistocerca nitens TaxID=7011 RepID=UPI0021185FB1|nr:uncharacterized protein LOC126263107 [Schistocerca nitens]
MRVLFANPRPSKFFKINLFVTSKDKTGFYYSHTKGNIPIQFFGPVFCVESIVKTVRTLGPLYHKKESPVADHLFTGTLRSCATFKSNIQISFLGSFVLHGSNGQATSKVYERVAVAHHLGNIKVTQLSSPSSERQYCDNSSEPPSLVESVIDTQCIPRCDSPYC